MAMVPGLKQEEIEELGDITANLTSLQFESALLPSEKQILHLRKRSHAHTVTVCAQATYYAIILNEGRQICTQLKTPTRRRATRIIQDGASRDILRIGIIGCGRLGSHIAHCLLSFGEFNPEEVYISTRRPETLIDLQEKGVMCVSDNATIASKADLLFLCVLPSQFPTVAHDIAGHIKDGSVVYSLIGSLPIPRMKQLMKYNNIIRPEFEWDDECRDKPWNENLEITANFAKRDILEMTCPLSFRKSDCVLRTKEKLAEQMVYSFVNMCTKQDVCRSDTVDVLNAVLLGHTSRKPLDDALQQEDITKYTPKDKEVFPYFDLSTTINRDTPVTKKLVHNAVVRQAFVQRYCFIFQQFLDWRNTALQQARKQLTVTFN